MARLPAGEVTFVFTDIEGSTRLFQRLGNAYPGVLKQHEALLRRAFDQHGGVVVKTEGDALFSAFDTAGAAVGACLDAQLALTSHPWPAGGAIRVRMGLHTGHAQPVDDDYVALPVHQAARIATAAHGGQVLLSGATATAAGPVPSPVRLADLGHFLLRDFDEPCMLFELRHPDLPSSFPPPRVPSATRHNLPPPRTSMIGRTAERDTLSTLLRQSRLVTVTGAGGVGKTRLATAVALESVPDYADGVWLVELASISNGGSVASAIAGVLRIDEKGGALPRVCEHLAASRAMLILDNCEHVLGDAAVVVDALITSCPELSVLATSRAPLATYGETVLKLTPFPPSLAASGGSDAVRLFVQRARLARPDFALSLGIARRVASICDRVDGLPLAIELAAARVGTMDPADIDRELEARFDVLGRTHRSGLRHSTITDLVGWSYELLTPAERACFRCLAVFKGGFTLDSLRGVVVGDDLSSEMVVGALLSLADHCLVEFGEGRGAPYRLLETVRSFASEQLAAAGQTEIVQRRHLAWYLGLAEAACAELIGPDQVGWFERLRQESANLQGALGYARDQRDAKAVTRLSVSLHEFWVASGQYEDGARWLQMALDGHAGDALERARTLLAFSEVAGVLGRRDAARAAAQEALTRGEELRDAGIVAQALTGRSNDALKADDIEQADRLARRALVAAEGARDRLAQARAMEALAHIEERLGHYDELLRLRSETTAIYREVGHIRGLGRALADLAVAAGLRGDLEAARAWMKESADLAQEVGDRTLAMQTLSNLAYLCRVGGDLETARHLAEDSVSIAREAGHLSYLGLALNNLAEVAVDQGDHVGALSSYADCLSIATRLGDSERAAFCLDGFALLSHRTGESGRAVRLAAAAASLRTNRRVALPAAYQAINETLLVEARDRLGPSTFADLWSAGLSLDLHEAAALALAWRPPHHAQRTEIPDSLS